MLFVPSLHFTLRLPLLPRVLLEPLTSCENAVSSEVFSRADLQWQVSMGSRLWGLFLEGTVCDVLQRLLKKNLY